MTHKTVIHTRATGKTRATLEAMARERDAALTQRDYLLAALEALFTAIGETCIDFGSEQLNAAVQSSMEQARAAIARAKGE